MKIISPTWPFGALALAAIAATAHAVAATSGQAPWSIDSYAYQTTLTTAQGQASDRFGNAIAVARDGNTIVVGDSNRDPGSAPQTGAAFAYTRSGSNWTEQALIPAGAQSTDAIGTAVAVSADGRVALVGAPVTLQGLGVVYVYTRSASTGPFSLVQTLSSNNAIGGVGYFGQSVALSRDGSIALVGAPHSRTSDVTAGTAFVFARSGNVWTEQARLDTAAPDQQDGADFGISVAVSANGSTALIGADQFAGNGNTWQGAVFTFHRSDTTWTLQPTLTAGLAYDRFGAAIAVSDEGCTALIGAPGTDSSSGQGGAAFMFRCSTGAWQQSWYEIKGDYTDFGSDVALSSAGGLALISAPNLTGATTGTVYREQLLGANWVQTQLATGGSIQDNSPFGLAVGVSGDGRTAAAGQTYATVGANSEQGAVYLYHDALGDDVIFRNGFD